MLDGEDQGGEPGIRQGYVSVARHLVLNRRYPEGVAYYRKAMEAEPKLWVAHSELGINLMRLGEEDEPQKELELAYNNGQTDAATANSLKLLDSYKNFVTTKDDTTILRMYKSESDLLQPYFEEQLHKAIATYSAKYKMKLEWAGAVGGVSEPRGLRGADDGDAGAGRAGRDVWQCGGDGFAVGTEAWGFQLGRDDVARDEPRIYFVGDKVSRAAVVYRGAGSA